MLGWFLKTNYEKYLHKISDDVQLFGAVVTANSWSCRSITPVFYTFKEKTFGSPETKKKIKKNGTLVFKIVSACSSSIDLENEQ